MVFFITNGVDLIHEFFNFERKTNSSLLSKSIQLLNKNHKNKHTYLILILTKNTFNIPLFNIILIINFNYENA